MPPDDSGQARSRVADRLHSAAIHLLRRLRHVDLESGTTSARLSVLSILVFSGPRTISELAALEQVSLPTMSRMVADMERDGHVTRRRETEDRRHVRALATAAGEELLRRAQRRRLEQLSGLLDDLDADELATLDRAADLMERVSRAGR